MTATPPPDRTWIAEAEEMDRHAQLEAYANRYVTRPAWTTGPWWLDVLDRTVRTAAQAALGALGTAVVLQGANWTEVGSTAAFAAVACVLMSLAAPPRSSPVPPRPPAAG